MMARRCLARDGRGPSTAPTGPRAQVAGRARGGRGRGRRRPRPPSAALVVVPGERRAVAAGCRAAGRGSPRAAGRARTPTGPARRLRRGSRRATISPPRAITTRRGPAIAALPSWLPRATSCSSGRGSRSSPRASAEPAWQRFEEAIELQPGWSRAAAQALGGDRTGRCRHRSRTWSDRRAWISSPPRWPRGSRSARPSPDTGSNRCSEEEGWASFSAPSSRASAAWSRSR